MSLSVRQVAEATGCPLPAVSYGWPMIRRALNEAGILEHAVEVGVAATIAIEAKIFEPVREAYFLGEEDGSAEAFRRTLDYYPFYGRGWPQLTHEGNYRAAGEALGLDLVAMPDLALQPWVSARIMAWFWKTRGVPSKDGSRFYTFVDLCREGDWHWVRKAFNGGLDRFDEFMVYVRALEAFADSEKAEGPMPTAYTPDFPLQLQRRDDTCAVRSLAMILSSIGILVDAGDLQDLMATDENRLWVPDVGNRLASGELYPAFVRQHWGLAGRNLSPASFDDVLRLAGRQPLMIGGAGWGAAGHWTAVRRADGEVLVLANPGGTGAVYGQQTLTREQFNARARFSLVTIDLAPQSPPVIVAPPAPPVVDHAACETRIRGLEIALADACDRLGDRAQSVVDELRALREQFIGERPAA